MTIAEQISLVRQNISDYCLEARRDPPLVRLLAVSKNHSAEAIQSAYQAGVTEFGESYLQEALEKIKSCQSLSISWHFIGPIQSNKTRPIAEHFDWVQSVDREKILRRLSEQRPSRLPALNICIQADFFNEQQKQGVSEAELNTLLSLCESLPNLKLRGLMVIPPVQTDFARQISQFAKVQQIYQQLQRQYPGMDTLSMGMSSDIRAAIFQGSDMVRVGTAIFGERSPGSKS